MARKRSANTYHGVYLRDVSQTLVQGNYIGTDKDGTGKIPNLSVGVYLLNSPNNRIGGEDAGTRNVISGNGGVGIQIEGASATDNVVQGNFIGTSRDGNQALGNTGSGVFITNSSSKNRIGGTTPSARNIISGNLQYGILMTGSGNTRENQVQGNYIGTDVSGTLRLSNGYAGVALFDGATVNSVGGTAPGAGNVISANGDAGISITNNG